MQREAGTPPAPWKVGIVGANARGGWAAESHVPAVQALDGFELAAVATNRRETADEARRAFGATEAYASGTALIAESGVDLVAVTTRVPDHRDLVLAALAAGRHVYCEWPLGRDVAEARAMADAARAAGVRTAIGLQLRGSPAVRRAREMIASGALGRVLSVRATSSVAGFGADVPPAAEYLEDPANFANLVTIQGAHTIDLVLAVAGPLRSLSALMTRQFPEVRFGDAGIPRPRMTYDHMLVQGVLVGGAAVSVAVAGARPPETPAWIEVATERGVLRLDGGGARGVQSSRMTLTLDGALQTVDADPAAGLPDTALNVAGVYDALRAGTVGGTSPVADFDHAVRLTQLVADAFAASEAGSRVAAGGWPDR